MPHSAGASHRSECHAGILVAIGGSESKDGVPEILGRFVYAAGGRHADILLIPIASSLQSTAERYRATFRHLGAASVQVLHPKTSGAANDPEAVAMVGQASAIFFTGGDQYRLAQRLAGTALERAIREAHARGTTVGGTSAGASFLSRRMIAYGKSGSTPRHDLVNLADGLGLTSRFIIDQHFQERNRMGRLLTALALCPGAMGLGLDEGTAAVLDGDSLEVVGDGAITVLDGRRMDARVPHHWDRHDPICLTNVRMHILVHGARFDVRRRRATPPSATEKEPRQ